MIKEKNNQSKVNHQDCNSKSDTILFHFYQNILGYLCKFDRLNASLVNKQFYHIIFPNIHRALTLTSKYHEVHSDNDINSIKTQVLLQNLNDSKSMFKHLELIAGLENLKISNITFDSDLLSKIKLVVENSIIDVFSQSNLSFDSYQTLESYHTLLNQITAHITEFKIYGVSNKDKLVLHLEKNDKSLRFLALKSVTIDNLPISQIYYLLNTAFESRRLEIESLMIEHCALDEELGQLVNVMIKYKNLKVLSLSNCGLSSYAAKDAFKLILNNLKSLTTLYIKGVWIECAQMVDLCETISKINSIEVLSFCHSGSLLTDSFGIESNFFRVLNGLNKITEFDLTDCKMRSLNVRRMLENLEECNNLRLLNLRKNYLDDDAISYFIESSSKLNHLSDLIISLNPMITTKGFICLIKEMSDNQLTLRNLQLISCVSCRISFGQAYDNMIQLLFSRSQNELQLTPSIDMMFCDVKDKDIIHFLDAVLLTSNKSYETTKQHQQIKSFLKIKRDITSKADLFKKIQDKLLECYIRHNLTIK